MSKHQQKVIFQAPIMSWERPIELEILDFVRSMKRSWASHHNIWGQQKEINAYTDAYSTVEKHILREIEFRKEVGKS